MAEFVSINGLRMHVQTAGEGQPLLFISGTGGDLRNRPNQLDTLLTEQYQLIAYDQRGLGQTSNPPEAFSMGQYADDAAALLDHLELQQVAVMGVSFGGMVAQELLVRHPSRVQCAVLACTSSGGAGGASYPLHELVHLDDEERVTRHLKVSDLRHTDEWIAANPERWQKRLAMALAAQRNDRDRDGAYKQLLARAAHDCYAELDKITAPVLLAGGLHDGVAPVSNMQAMAAQIPNNTLKLFDGGHMFLVQDKTAYPYIRDWLLAHT